MEEKIYDGLVGIDFLKKFFLNHGITEDELFYYEAWDCFYNCYNIINDDNGFYYAAKCVDKIKAYRNVTIEDIRKDYSISPWAWDSAKRFYKINYESPHQIKVCRNRLPILRCYYNNELYYFNINKGEPYDEESERMLKEGLWQVYTWSD